MIKLVKLHLLRGDGSEGAEIFVNPYQVAVVRQIAGGTEIMVATGVVYEVKESAHEVVGLLQKVGRQ